MPKYRANSAITVLLVDCKLFVVICQFRAKKTIDNNRATVSVISASGFKMHIEIGTLPTRRRIVFGMRFLLFGVKTYAP